MKQSSKFLFGDFKYNKTKKVVIENSLRIGDKIVILQSGEEHYIKGFHYLGYILENNIAMSPYRISKV